MALKYVDLFAGCGGLSLGMEKAGFELALAVEKSNMAAETFCHNFIKRIAGKEDWENYCSQSSELQAKSKLVVNELRAVLDNKKIMESLVAQEIDVIVGGPPCQGFSLAGRRNPQDVRNQLPWQFLEMVEKLSPKAVVMENVVGIRRRFKKHDHESPFDQLQEALRQTGSGYQVQAVELNALHFGAPQHRPRVMILALRKDVTEKIGASFVDGVWRSDFDNKKRFGVMLRPTVAPLGQYFEDQILTTKDALWDIDGAGYKVKSTAHDYAASCGKYANEMRQSKLQLEDTGKANSAPQLKNHVLRKHTDRVKNRFRLYQALKQNAVPPRILNIPTSETLENAEKIKKIGTLIDDIAYPLASPDGTIIAETKSELEALIIELQTKKHSQRPLSFDEPSSTILSLPDDFVHPSEARTLTVREMARLQSFPDSFEFRSKETTGSDRRRFEVPQYTQVGNAVPPKMAYAVGSGIKRCLEALQAKANRAAEAS